MAAGAPGEPSFSRIGLVGLGLIGGSIARRCRAVWPSVAIVGVDRPDVVATARGVGAIDASVASVSQLVDVDLIVLATPLPAILDALADLGRVSPAVTITDVGSTKRQVMAAARTAGLEAFVGGHPMAGAERGGFEAARADLFVGRPWLLVSESAAPPASRRVEAFVRAMGALPSFTTADGHDRVVACVSHLPQILSVALMNAAIEALGQAGLAAAGPAFVEMTRLASSPQSIWQGILASNADFVMDALGALEQQLPPGAPSLQSGDWTAEAFGRAAAGRAALTQTRRPSLG